MAHKSVMAIFHIAAHAVCQQLENHVLLKTHDDGVSFRFQLFISLQWGQIMSGKTPFNLGHSAGWDRFWAYGPKTLQLRRTTFEFEARTSPSCFSGCPRLVYLFGTDSYFSLQQGPKLLYYSTQVYVLLCELWWRLRFACAQSRCTCRGTQNDCLLGKATVFTKVYKQDNVAMSREFETSSFTFSFSPFCF
jgi:hypothetical protein